ncbi:hypothetical protein BUZ67_12510, partial [Staphylococcus pasteuri]|uniref:LlaJI family restriction endonuclease n=1 Tax=Staphylococcus pasteuri TaxID=45972 RepID=UPI000D4B4903
MTKFAYFIEGANYSFDKVPKVFIEKQYFVKTKSNEYKCKVTGVSNYKNINYIFFPKGYKNFNRTENDAINLFKSINKYRKEITLTDEESDWIGENSSDIENINLCSWLISDFQRNGIYTENRERKSINNNGKIDWAKTIKKQLPIIQDDKLIYLNLITKKNIINNENVVST